MLIMFKWKIGNDYLRRKELAEKKSGTKTKIQTIKQKHSFHNYFVCMIYIYIYIYKYIYTRCSCKRVLQSSACT